jgi:hypothetical protein
VIRDDLPLGRSVGKDRRTRHREPDRTWRDCPRWRDPWRRLGFRACTDGAVGFSETGSTRALGGHLRERNARVGEAPATARRRKPGFRSRRLDGRLQAEFHHSPGR